MYGLFKTVGKYQWGSVVLQDILKSCSLDFCLSTGMKMMLKKLLVLVLWACFLSVSTADNTVVPVTNQVTKPGGQTTNKINNSIPSSA